MSLNIIVEPVRGMPHPSVLHGLPTAVLSLTRQSVRDPRTRAASRLLGCARTAILGFHLSRSASWRTNSTRAETCFYASWQLCGLVDYGFGPHAAVSTVFLS